MFRTLTYSKPCLPPWVQTYLGIFTSYSDTFKHIVVYSEPCVTVAYSEPCHYQNPDMFRTQDIFWFLPRHMLAYLEYCVKLAYWVPCRICDPRHIQNRHIQACSIMIFIITVTFFFFHQNLKRHMYFNYNDINFNARLSVLN